MPCNLGVMRKAVGYARKLAPFRVDAVNLHATAKRGGISK